MPGSQDGTTFLRSTSWQVHVARDTKSTLGGGEERVTVAINGAPTPLVLLLGAAHDCAFPGGALVPTDADLAALARPDGPLRPGRNELRFRLASAPNAPFYAALHVWDAAAAAVVACDIDGTLTRSELLGHASLAPRLGWDPAHPGAAAALAAIAAAGCRALRLLALTHLGISYSWTPTSISSAQPCKHRLPFHSIRLCVCVVCVRAWMGACVRACICVHV